VQGQRIAYLERQGSGETIVLLHGFGANKDNWLRFTRSLPKEYHVIAFDLPGHGDNSREIDKVYTIDFITQGFADAADALKLDRFHIAGNSMGGWVGILYTNRNPERVITLGLFDTAGINSPDPSDLQKAIEKGQNILIPTSEDAFKELMGYAFYKEPFIPWPVPLVLARKSVADAPFKQKMWNDMHSTYKDVASVLPDLRLPVLILWGAQDRITHVSSVQVLERYLPNSKTVIMPDCGHMPMLERPKEAAMDYVAFLKEHVKVPSPE
jgi:abhydrolase domain-containing protein 6